MVIDTLLLGLIAFILGYLWGKRRGRTAGFREGKTCAPLELRQQSLEHGYCMLCHSTRPDAMYTDRHTLPN